jgi:hypothetical protein
MDLTDTMKGDVGLSQHVNMRTTFHILTEENPQPQEILQILLLLGYQAQSCNIAPIYEADGTTLGKFRVVTNTGIECDLQLFKGETSSVDYIIVDNETKKPILLMESTQTTDKDSRNTAWNQRMTKFAVCRRMLPGVRMIMYYTDNMSQHTSGTATFGMSILATMGVEMWHPGGQMESKKFSTVEEVVEAKNRLASKCPSHSVPVTIARDGKLITISGRLNKTCGMMNNDPNIGLVTGIVNAIHMIDAECTFKIINHQLDVTKIREKNKFWFGVKGIALEIDGFNGERAPLPVVYYHEVKGGEKMSSILFQHHSGLPVAFHNHAGCQRSSIVSLNGTCAPVPKTVTMPDVVLVDTTNKVVYLTEGKDSSKIKSAQEQLDNLGPFMEICTKAYPGYTLKRGLCLYIDKPLTNTRYPVWFTLTPSGVCTKTLTA